MRASLVHGDLLTLEKMFRQYAEDFAVSNHAARVITRGISLVGVSIRPILDHFVFRTLHPEERVREFRELGYVKDPSVKIFSDKKISVEIYRCKCLPAVLIEKAHDHAAQEWIKTFGDQKPYIMAVRVDDLEEAEMHLERQGIGFIRPSAGKKGEELREIVSSLTFHEGKAANALVLVERHAGNLNYYAPDFWARA